MEPHSLFSLNDHLKALSQHGDPLEVLDRTVDFEYSGRGWSMGWVMAMVARLAGRPLIR